MLISTSKRLKEDEKHFLTTYHIWQVYIICMCGKLHKLGRKRWTFKKHKIIEPFSEVPFLKHSSEFLCCFVSSLELRVSLHLIFMSWLSVNFVLKCPQRENHKWHIDRRTQDVCLYKDFIKLTLLRNYQIAGIIYYIIVLTVYIVETQ